MRGWARRTARMHAELAELAELRERRWWLVAGGAALPWRERADYVASDAEPASDTFISIPRRPLDPLALARAARTAIRELSAILLDQPLAMTIVRDERGARTVASTLDIAAFARGDRVWCVHLDDPRRELELDATSEVPFVCISIGDEPIGTARHGHRRAWRAGRGPWLGIGASGDLTVVSTCHLAVDGYGHARLAARIAELTADAARVDEPSPPLAPVADAIPLAVTWRELPSRPRALELAYALGCTLHRQAGDPHARFSPTVQIPVAPGAQRDPTRMHRRVVPALGSVRFVDGVPEPFQAFAARIKRVLATEAAGAGVSARLVAAARAVPVPLAWKRRAIVVNRPRWLDSLADVIGGRGCVSRIAVDIAVPPMCAVSSPARMATPGDPLGSCVLTVIDDGTRASITLCGSGYAAAPARLDELLALLPGHSPAP